ncbi:MAG: tripartite tricarboxylate transporter substrate binding protein [Pseudomonadota bacterium]
MIRAICLVFILGMCQVPVWAQQCPGPLRIVVGLSAGGAMDAVARMLAQTYTQKFGQTMIVENKVGATGNIAAQYVSKAQPDGCTLIIRGNEHNVNPLIFPSAGYEAKNFDPVARVVSGPALLLVNASLPFNTVAELVAYAKANPGKLSYGTSGNGSANHVAMELFLKAARIQMVHVPYKGSSAALVDLVSGSVPVAVGSVSAALPFINSGKLRALAVTGPTRWPSLPNVPTMNEAGHPAAGMVYWMGILAPAGTPLAVRKKFNQSFRVILGEASIRERLHVDGWNAISESVDDFGRFLQHDERISRKLMNDLQVKIE